MSDSSIAVRPALLSGGKEHIGAMSDNVIQSLSFSTFKCFVRWFEIEIDNRSLDQTSVSRSFTRSY